MKSKSFILMILSLGFGLVAAIGISQVMKTNNANATPVQQMGTVLVAADHLDIKTELNEENVRIENWPANIIPEDAVRTLEEIKDQAITVRLSKGMPVVKSQLANKRDVGLVKIPPGFKVLAVKVGPESTASGLLSPGDKVDIIGLFKRRNKSGREQIISKTFLKGIRVFAVNGNMNAVVGDREEGGNGNGSAIVSLLVTETQSEEVAFVQKVGDIKLSMRGENEGDDDQVESIADIMKLEEDDDAEEEPKNGPAENNSSWANMKMPAFQPAVAQPAKPESMIVFKGGEPRKVIFADGLPQDVGLSPSDDTTFPSPRAPRMDPVAEDTDEGNFDGRIENDRGINEDQYRSE